MSLRYLFIDFDSFFASVEQQFQPHLRGKPVGVVPSLGVETTCCIAASYEAKARGVKTGTGVREARYLCPGIQFVQADHTRYILTHNKIHKIIHEIIYVDAVLSIDEMFGRLPPHWQPPAVARAKALEIKAALKAQIGPYIGASIGLAPNRFLAKLASKLEKPDGLTTLDFDELPEKLYRFELEDITGIGRRMQERLRTARITTMEELCDAPRHTLHRIWKSVEGDRMWYALRGIEMPLPETTRQTIGHSHVLPPSLRSERGAHATLHRMLQKACRRLRAMEYFTGHLDLQVKFGFDLGWHAEAKCFPTQDNVTILRLLNRLWDDRPRDLPDPTKVGITLTHLVHANSHTPSLFREDNHPRRMQLQHAMDKITKEHGGRSLYYADAHQAQRSSEAAPMRISFTHIPDLELENE
ncbi:MULTISPECIES: DNA polymerase [unclassified Lentimonas]|uniref:DNA polymerase Y family protein n=1 Tax=unclassified Lentimonas TaxID=2630993 RepID=UPI00132301BE|nr:MULTISPECIES: DNA polymerase [unclassified Lentimonas]CAA6690305.1 DNA polymerase IV (EC [Lentimonas sp. CC10]CAA6693038.1 DNA polymerase IV (EC [Lentimonas sp. CC19]CAA7069055.1 DNA polymerase IV (EC [Lentimonas sp. CC11]